MASEKIRSILNRMIGRTLSLAENNEALCAPLAGKLVILRLKEPDWCVRLSFHEQGFILSDDETVVPDLVLEGKALDFLGMLRAKGTVIPGEIKLSGDIQLGQALSALFKELDIDWEAHAATYVGDVAAHELGKFLKFGREKIQYAHQRFEENLTRFLQDEKKWLVHPIEMREFSEAVTKVRHGTARLEQRIQHLKDKS